MLIEKLIGSQLVKKFPAFYGTLSQKPTACPYPEPEYPRLYFAAHLIMSNFYIFSSILE
jgi:hypothetical protein